MVVVVVVVVAAFVVVIVLVLVVVVAVVVVVVLVLVILVVVVVVVVVFVFVVGVGVLFLFLFFSDRGVGFRYRASGGYGTKEAKREQEAAKPPETTKRNRSKLHVIAIKQKGDNHTRACEEQERNKATKAYQRCTGIKEPGAY